MLRRLLVVGAMVAVAVAVTGTLAITDHDTVNDRRELAEASFGRPFDWLHQDLTYLDPPSFPREYRAERPHDAATRISAGPFLLTAGGFLAVELLAGAAVLGFRRRRA